ncbi:MAG: hypothetical protein AAGI69_26780 [Cyanobacteria bacterium P01_H01_bin.21]
MSEPLKSKYELILWNLLLTGDEPQVSKIKPKMTTAECKPLIQQGLIKLEKRGRANHLVLEDKAWDWMSERLQSEDFKAEFSPRATTAIPIFQTFLMRLGQYMRLNDVPLVEFLKPALSSSNVSIDHQPSHSLLEERIRKAYASLTQTSSDFRVRIAHIHQAINDIPHQTVNDTLRAMQQAGTLSLRPMEDPEEIALEDEKAAIDLGGGDKRYFIFIK